MAKNREPREPTELEVIERPEIEEENELFIGFNGKPIADIQMFNRFSCDVPNASPPTPDRVEPDETSYREFYEEDLPILPGGREVRIFGFKTEDGEPVFPSPTLRYTQGKIIHSTLKVRKNTHTIHHHGIEPTNFNDGVGHTSFEVKSEYTYQFLTSQAGTYIYHCHKNTVLHFEMGMYGYLIVDPDVPTPGGIQPPFQDGGPGMVQRENEVIPYDVEALWAVDEFDTRWHEIINHQAGLGCPFYHNNSVHTWYNEPFESIGLNDFNPDVFLISGVAAERGIIENPRIAPRLRVGERLLIRLLNAGYTVQEYRFPSTDVEVIEQDGRPLGSRPRSIFSHPFVIEKGTPFRQTTARRYGMLFEANRPGGYPFEVRFLDWVSGKERGRLRTFIDVSV